MANITKSALADKVLEYLGVKAANQSADGSDTTLVQEAIDSVHERLTKYGFAPFATSAIPAWAQTPLRDIVAGDMAIAFGASGQRLVEFKAAGNEGLKEMARQVAGYKPPVAVIVDYF